MKLNSSILLTLSVLTTPPILTSCSHYSAQDIMRARNYGYQSGLQASRASQVRQDYHEEQEAKEDSFSLPSAGNTLLPALPEAPRKRYYEVPVPSHIASDGVKIEAHTQPIEILQP